MKQLNIAMPDGLRAFLEGAAEANGQTVAAEVRELLERASLETALPAPIRDLVIAIRDLGPLVRLQTGYDWYQSPEAFDVFCHALIARLTRWQPKVKPDKPSEPPQRLIPSDDPKQVGLALDAILFSRGGLVVEENPAMVKEALKAAMRERDKGGARRQGKQMKNRKGIRP